MAFQFKKFKKDEQSELSESELKMAMLPSEFWLVGLALFFLYIYYIPLYIKNTGGFLEGFLMGVIPVIAFPFLVYKTIRSFKPRSKWRIWLPLISILCVGPILIGLNQYQFNKVLSSKVKQTKAILIREMSKNQNKQNKVDSVSHFFLQYSIESQSFKPRIYPDITISAFQAGDTIELTYSIDHPNIFKISNTTKLQKVPN